jgi:Fe-S-cluster containining protein
MIAAFEDGVRFGCMQCGKCCALLRSDIALSHHDVTRISGNLGLSAHAFIKNYGVYLVNVIRQAGRILKLPCVALRVPKSERCAFLDGSNRCSIHKVKPFICSHSPFIAYVAEGAASVWKEALSYCPGIGRGEWYDRNRISRLLREERDAEQEDFKRLEECEGDLERVFDTRLPKPVIREIRLPSMRRRRLFPSNQNTTEGGGRQWQSRHRNLRPS